MDREDFYRLKCVQDKKQEAKDLEEAEAAARLEKLKKNNEGAEDKEAAQENFFDENKLADDEDEEDVIF